ncbi:hypothetical protein Q4588_14200 [Tamlana sp. 1_MG-2023]|uniref:hypothetical protein n=1 Tax=Tamlana sp. 1_MG-2023 TaxID=3062628 RepID=UPI0026E1242C|nr:hypothetical protein [Tamlana sp. 1_MG-2023]MDO6792057.1 hypothetical protein [Tamlana sp. 1_MG-2023]
MEVNGKSIEELGFEASKKGCFKAWESLRETIKTEKNMSINDASEMALKELLSKN